MRTVTFRHNSISFKLAVIFIAATFAQCAFMLFMLITGGVIRETQDNAYTYFSLQVESRKGNLESQMKHVWTNLGDFPAQISQQFDQAREEGRSEEDQDQTALRASVPYLLELLDTTKTTGVFLILDDETEHENQHSAIYIRNTDVGKSEAGSFTLSLMAGPLDLAQEYQMSTSENWSWRLPLNETNHMFYEKAYHNVGLNADKKLLAYWSPPFTLTDDTEQVLTYSIPMNDAAGNPIGVLGIEISVNHLYRFLPKHDLSAYHSLGYILGMKETEDGPIYPVVARGAEQLKLLDFEKPFDLVEKKPDYDIYEIKNINSPEPILGSIKQMGMYYNNTPYSNEQWYLIGLEESAKLLNLSENVFRIMSVSLMVTVLFGIIVAIVSSRIFSIPVIKLAKEVKALSQNEVPKQSLTSTGLAEIDELSEAIIAAQQKLLELNAKLTYERDRDSLTGIRNRHAFHIEKDYHNTKIDSYEKIGIGIFDLNDLKYINDNFGHAEGDYYLCLVAHSISRVFHECSVFRIGGDEFAIIIINLDEDDMERNYEELCSLLEKKERKKMFKGGVAFGYAFWDPNQPAELEQVMSLADKQMYEKKKYMKESEH